MTKTKDKKLFTVFNLGESGWSRISPFNPSRAILFFTACNLSAGISRILHSGKQRICAAPVPTIKKTEPILYRKNEYLEKLFYDHA
jgi:hypothetical protein